MKKKIIAFVFGAAMCSGAAFAQESGFGAKLGVNLANASGDVEETSMRTSLHLGVYYNYMVSDKFAIQPELVYSGQGYKQTFDLGPFGGEVDAVTRLDYLNIPIMAKYYVTESLHLHAGPQIGINIGAKSVIDGESEDIEDVSTLDMGLGFGLGYELESGLNFGFRYNLGMSNVNNNEDTKDDFKVMNNVIQIGAGWQF